MIARTARIDTKFQGLSYSSSELTIFFHAVRTMLPTVDVTAGTMEDDPTADGTKEEPARFGEDGHLALEHLPAVSLASDASPRSPWPGIPGE